MNKRKIDLHADDFGITKNSTDDIISLIKMNALNSISILPNMTAFEYAQNQLIEIQKTLSEEKKIKISVHLNFMEGHCCADPQLIPDLIDSKGYFKISWGKLFIWNYIPWKNSKIKKQLKEEILAQTKKCIDSGVSNPSALRFDSHQHTHMIPIVYKALFSAIDDLQADSCKIEYIRNTEDPIFPYLKNIKLWKTYSPTNILKCLILNYYSFFFRHKIKKLNIIPSYLFGVFFSGNMDFSRISKILPNYERLIRNKERTIELLFHPGSVKENEITEEFVKKGFVNFHLSNGRKIEFDALKKLIELN